MSQTGQMNEKDQKDDYTVINTVPHQISDLELLQGFDEAMGNKIMQ